MAKQFLLFIISFVFIAIGCKNNQSDQAGKASISSAATNVLDQGKIEQLIDGTIGNDTNDWIISSSPFLEGVIDLSKPDTVDQISTRFFIDKSQNILPPRNISFFFSQDGEEYNEIPAFTVRCPDSLNICDFYVPTASTNMRFIKFKFENLASNSKIQLDEIKIN
jgi:hypothetical protein